VVAAESLKQFNNSKSVFQSRFVSFSIHLGAR